ncbi:hypothetical protein [Microbaculum sp. FT89]|uniref:hypothetical protein n=1 Tax=Microbaculum sp. FT89 TaxID=3447298 RepID=UPI003F5306B9
MKSQTGTLADRGNIMATNEERWNNTMNAEFNPNYSPNAYPDSDMRIANATEYAAFQLYKIREAIEGINSTLKAIASKT